MFRKYECHVILRPDPDNEMCTLAPEDWSTEREFRTYATAPNELQARRSILERAYATGYLVSRFLEFQEIPFTP